MYVMVSVLLEFVSLHVVKDCVRDGFRNQRKTAKVVAYYYVS